MVDETPAWFSMSRKAPRWCWPGPGSAPKRPGPRRCAHLQSMAKADLADGERVVDVPAKLSARVRLFDTGYNLTTHARDAHAVAVVTARSKVPAGVGLPNAAHGPQRPLDLGVVAAYGIRVSRSHVTGQVGVGRRPRRSWPTTGDLPRRGASHQSVRGLLREDTRKH